MGFDCTFYNICFFTYVFLVPAFLQYLIRAPSTFNSAPFHPVPLETLQGKVAAVNMSSPPQTMEKGVNHCRPCYEDEYHKEGRYQWDIMLGMSYQDLVSNAHGISTMYPVIIASNDFKTWKVVADADDVAGEVAYKEDEDPEGKGTEPTHISPPSLIANMKTFGCVTNETGLTDPFMWFFASSGKAQRFKWKLVEHISMHGSVNLVACVIQGFQEVNKVMSNFAQTCIHGTEMSCLQTARQALGQCFAIGSACGQACGFFSPGSKHCKGGLLDSAMFQGLTTKRVQIKTASGGHGSNALVHCEREPCKTGLHFKDMYVEADNPRDFMSANQDLAGDFYTMVFAVNDPGHEDVEEHEHPSNGLGPDTKFRWQIAHVPNLTMGVMKDHSSNTMRITPARESCFSQPGFSFIVACMTAKPVYTSGEGMEIEGPPFNDRCLALGGLCGATCGSGETLDNSATHHCPNVAHALGSERRLAIAKDSPYATAQIPMDMLVEPIESRRSAMTASTASRFFFHGFIFFVVISYVATILSKFPGCFTDFYPMHTWDEIKTHGYVLEKFGCACAWGVSAGEHKMIVLRNWVGKIAARPHFADRAFPSFKRWVDFFADEGHREGARLLWLAWTDFLDTNPPLEFLEQWSQNTRDLTWAQAHSRSPFDVVWKDERTRKVLPVTPEQGNVFAFESGATVPPGGVELEQDTLAKLHRLSEIYKILPDDLKMEMTINKKDDCVLTRTVNLGFQQELSKRNKECATVPFSSTWRQELQNIIAERTADLGLESQEAYKKMIKVTDVKGHRVKLSDEALDALTQKCLPLHIREPCPHRDRKVVMVYAARAKPENDRKGIEKTRGLDRYLWACLRPSAVKPYMVSQEGSSSSSAASHSSGSQGGRFRRRGFRGQQRLRDPEQAPLLEDAASVASSVSLISSASTRVPENNKRFERIRACVEECVDRQHQKYVDGLEDFPSSTKKLRTVSDFHKDYAERYHQYRVIDSDWEVGRHCYGEIVGEDVDADGDEVLILDNPSAPLLELVSSATPADGSAVSTGMGLVAMSTVTEVTTCGMLKRTRARVAYATKPTLEFFFTNTEEDENEQSPSSPQDFERALREKLQLYTANPKQEISGIEVKQTPQGSDIIVQVVGSGKITSEIRERISSTIMVLKFQGRIMDNHPTILVKKKLLMPYCGVRGKGGGLNFAVDLLQFREGFIGTALEGDPTPQRMLFGIFDARHQPHPNFWRMVLPKFMQNKDGSFTYEVNPDVAMVQAPQSFAGLKTEDDTLDVLNGASFNIMNVIRNRCGGVTSCGTNAVWQINASDFSRLEDDDVNKEYFESRTKIEDTATTHVHFCKGKRSVYVHEKVSTGIAKVNADYLGAVQRWAEGAVQLFWVQLFVDKTWQLVIFAWCALAYMGIIFYMLYGKWAKELIGVNLFCDSPGVATLLLGDSHGFCTSIYRTFFFFLGHNIDRVIYRMAEDNYMTMIDVTLTWLCFCFFMAFVTVILSWRGTMPKIVRTFIMMENISYFWTSSGMFFWFALAIFMVMSTTPPLQFNVSHFALFILGIKVTEHSMLNYYKAIGESDELSVWRGQQMYTLAAPLYIFSIAQGTLAAWGITWKNLDKSFWNATDHGADVIKMATMWTTFIWIMFIVCVVFTITMSIRFDFFADIQSKFERQCQLGACWMLMLMAITVWEPLLNFWGFDKTIEALSKDESRSFLRHWANFNLWWRSRAWLVRYAMDFALPFVILTGLAGNVGLFAVLAYATTSQGGLHV